MFLFAAKIYIFIIMCKKKPKKMIYDLIREAYLTIRVGEKFFVSA